jgi:hypothetical protein
MVRQFIRLYSKIECVPLGYVPAGRWRVRSRGFVGGPVRLRSGPVRPETPWPESPASSSPPAPSPTPRGHVESDPSFGWFGVGHQAVQDFGDRSDLIVVQLDGFVESPELLDQFAGGAHQAAHLHEGAHDLDVHLHGGGRSQYAGQHGHAVFGEHPGRLSTPATSGV